ncbi:hypothetical protein P153DRAFT_354171 [Dothidotthia symphoricarpi CBS 119687]|uniref:Uncharacterized protein n=1 Tax=Dothidotthia symphoricarpi CBS 119687 TaxID=1392245 RepID=A0A6A6ANS0_9PLEO|nr:uncharacterized protein P153DRAFT_354171 [Dothidotthia symphoricarpi CBS 119687]KAF2132695.1 hypothetical protein P153DRAFT_354171 [Dothidotthia symphoricarpi CBS 119687]
MAPRKPAKTKNLKPAKTGDAGVVKPKRNARGYHRFRSGMLNMTPKDGEKELVRINQNSPLLRLPPEIRNHIWEYAVGGYTVQGLYGASPGHHHRPSLKVFERTDGLALLRTCRQVFAETALVPWAASLFAFNHPLTMRQVMKKLKGYQRKSITMLRLDVHSPNQIPWWNPLRNPRRFLTQGQLTGVKHVHLRVFRCHRVIDYSVTPVLENLRAFFPGATTSCSTTKDIWLPTR